MRPNRPQIRFGFPKGGNGVGDTFLFTSVCRYTDVTYEIPVDSHCASDIASILQSVARIEFVHEPIKEEESLALYTSQYGSVSPLPSRGIHAGRRWLLRYGINAPSCIPYARPPYWEVDWAIRWLAQYRNPIVFTPLPGGITNLLDKTARDKYVEPGRWAATLERLARTHDILYFTARDNYIPFPHVKTLLGFSVAKIASIMHLCRRHVGVENGLLHLAVAMGATCRVGIPEVSGGSAYEACDSYVYTAQVWDREECRTFYHLFKDGSDQSNIVFP